MVRSLLPLTVIVLALVGLVALRQNDADPVRTVDTTSSTQLAAARASYPLLVPQDLPEQWRATSIRTDAGAATEDGDPVTLAIGWVTPEEAYAGYVVGDDPRADDLTAVLSGAVEVGAVEVGGRDWVQLTTQREETAYRLDAGDDVLAVVTGSASDDELRTLAAAVAPYPAGVTFGSGRGCGLGQPFSGSVQPVLADLGQRLAALPQGQGLLEGQPAALQLADDVGELLAGLLVALGRRGTGRCPGRGHGCPSCRSTRTAMRPPATRTASDCPSTTSAGSRTRSPSVVCTRA